MASYIDGDHHAFKLQRGSLIDVPDDLDLSKINVEDERILPSSASSQLAHAVIELFKRTGITVSEAADKSGLSIDSVMKLRRGDATLRLGTIRKFAEAFGQPADQWLQMLNKIDVPDAPVLKDNILDVTGLSASRKALLRLTADQFMVEKEPNTLLAQEAIRQPFRAGVGLEEGTKVTAIAAVGPDYPGLLGAALSRLSDLDAEILTVSARGYADQATLYFRVVVDSNIPEGQIQSVLAESLNENARSKGNADKSRRFVVFAADEDKRNRGPLIGIALEMYNEPGALKAILACVYNHGWVPLGVEHSITEHSSLNEAKCSMALEPLAFDAKTFNMTSAAQLVADLRQKSIIIDAQMAFDPVVS